MRMSSWLLMMICVRYPHTRIVSHLLGLTCVWASLYAYGHELLFYLDVAWGDTHKATYWGILWHLIRVWVGLYAYVRNYAFFGPFTLPLAFGSDFFSDYFCIFLQTCTTPANISKQIKNNKKTKNIGKYELKETDHLLTQNILIIADKSHILMSQWW